jgi:hypothetical protein
VGPKRPYRPVYHSDVPLDELRLLLRQWVGRLNGRQLIYEHLAEVVVRQRIQYLPLNVREFLACRSPGTPWLSWHLILHS